MEFMDNKWLAFEDLNYRQLDDLPRGRTVFVLSLGPLEEHGPHLPFGVDVFVAELMAEELMEHIHRDYPDFTIIKFPPIYIGSGGIRWLGTLNSKQRTVRKIIIDYCRNLGKHGFKYVLISNGHGGLGHVVALEEAARYSSRKFNMSVISPSGRIAYEFLTGKYIDDIEQKLGHKFTDRERSELKNDSHAGWWETSVMLLMKPHLVQDSYKTLKEFVLTRPQRMRNKVYPGDQGYRGYPARANSAFACAVIDVMIGHSMTLIRDWLKGEDMTEKASSPLYKMVFFRTNFDRTVISAALLLLLTALYFWFS